MYWINGTILKKDLKLIIDDMIKLRRMDFADGWDQTFRVK